MTVQLGLTITSAAHNYLDEVCYVHYVLVISCMALKPLSAVRQVSY
jgi:hypothetical protein